MGHRCCSKQKVRRGLWSPEEDEKLVKYITTHGHGSWSSVPKFAGLQRCGKSCRLRWINYLRPDVRRGSFSAEEEQIIIDVHRILGNRWAQIAKHLPGRTDNEVKNFWNSCIKKKLISQGLDPKTHNMIPSHQRAAASNHHKVSSNIGATQSEHVQQPFSITNIVNSHSHTVKEANSNTETKPPTLTLPAAVPSPVDSMSIIQPSLLQTMSMPISSSSACGHQNPDANWTVDSHNSHDSTIVPWFSSTPQNTPISLANPYGGFAFNDLDENSFWGNNINNAVAQPSHVANNNFQEAIRLQEGMQLQDQEIQPRDTQTISSTLDTADQLEAKGGGHHQENMDASFDCSSFDLELVDSTLLSSSMYPYGLSSMDDFAWNF